MSKRTKPTDLEIAQARNWLRLTIGDGGRLYVNIRARSPSGMSRKMTLHVVGPNESILDVTYSAAVAAGLRMDDKSGRHVITIRGCGFNIAQHVAESVADALGYARLEYATI